MSCGRAAAGGQHQNKTESGVPDHPSADRRGRQLPRRAQPAQEQIEGHADLAQQAFRPPARVSRGNERDSARRKLMGSGDRLQRIRTYNFPQNRVTDHRIGLTLYNLVKDIQGELLAQT